jgi:hypothetical protein
MEPGHLQSLAAPTPGQLCFWPTGQVRYSVVKVPLGEGLPTEPSSVGCHVVGVKVRYLVGKLLTAIESLGQLW